MPCVTVSRELRQALVAAIEADPTIEVTIDLEASQVRYGEKRIPCSMREGNRQALTTGRWDPLGDLLEAAPKVDAIAEKLPYLRGA